MGQRGVGWFVLLLSWVAHAEWECVTPVELAAREPPSKPWLSAKDRSRRAEYLRQAFFDLKQDGGTCSGVVVGTSGMSCGTHDAVTLVLSDGRVSNPSAGCTVPGVAVPDDVGGLVVGDVGNLSFAPNVPAVVQVVWRSHGELRVVHAKIVGEPPDRLVVVDGLLPPGAALLDDQDRFLGTVVRHVKELGVSVARIPAMTTPAEDTYRAALTGEQSSSQFLASIRIIGIGAKRAGVGMVVGVRMGSRDVMIVMPTELGERCAAQLCTVASSTGAPTGERLEPLSRGAPFTLWKLVGARKPKSLLPFEGPNRVARFEPVLAFTPEGRLVRGRVARGQGELFATVEVDFEEHVAAGALFNLVSGRFMGFAQAAGHGEITALERADWFWKALTGLGSP